MPEDKARLSNDPSKISMVLPQEQKQIMEDRMLHAELVRSLQKEIGENSADTVADFRTAMTNLS